MRRKVVHLTIVALACVGTFGCQSGPRWAWWKKDTPLAADSSAVARTAAPVLPSTQATPTAVAGTGLQPATSPSSANLASAGTATVAPLTAAPGIATASTTMPGSIYPTTGAPPIATAGALPTASNPSAQIAGTTNRAVPPAAAATAGPYDPNAYRGTTATAAATAAASGPSDRYASAPSAATPAVGRYPATGTPPTTTAQVAGPPPSATPSVAPGSADRYGILPVAGPSNTYTLPTPNDPAPVGYVQSPGPAPGAATVQASASAGQYRPAGTSDYVSGPAADHVEIATRPAAPTVTPTPTTPAAYPTAPYGTQPY